MMVAVVTPERIDTPATEDGDSATSAELEALSLSGHSVVVFVVVPTTTVRVPLAEPVMAPAEDVADVGEGEERDGVEDGLVSSSVHVLLAAPGISDAVDEVAVYVGVHSSAARVKVPS